MSVTFIFWFKALSYSENTSKTSNLIYISPFISLIFIHHILGERINMSTLYGITFIVIGILIQSINKKGEKYEKT
jgi:drug/metabolite transporter (DMT)-like permease